MPLPRFKTESTSKFSDNYAQLNYTDYQKEFIRKRDGVRDMLKAIWPEGRGDDTGFVREENGKPLEKHNMPPRQSDNYRDRVDIRNGLDSIAAFFYSSDFKGRLQILSPEDNKPHYLSVSEDKQEFIISDDPVPAPAKPEKPSLWDRFKSIFTKVPSVERYKEQKKTYDSYHEFCKKAQNVTAKRQETAANKQREEQAKLEKVQEKAPTVEKAVVREQPTEVKKTAATQKEVSHDTIVPKNEVAENFFRTVDAARKKDPRLDGIGLMAKKAMNHISGGISPFNSIKEDYMALGHEATVTSMATITAFHLMKDNPSILDTYKANPMEMVSKMAARRNEFAEKIGLYEETGLTKGFVDNFLQTGGESMKDSFEEIAIGCKIAAQGQMEHSAPQIAEQSERSNHQVL